MNTNCPHCNKDRSQFFYCCDKGSLIAGKSPSTKPNNTSPWTVSEIEATLDQLVDDGILSVSRDVDGEELYRLTYKGELIASVKGKPIGQA